ncbi:LVIVD repeat-containing protein [Natronococcus sp.]|uniref:LVIVD repeat-containing protein n=1 Tax=Natronococcus sp. TaxID=35747 RepID=UPI003A4DDC31
MKRTGVAGLTVTAVASGVATADRADPPGHSRRRARGRLDFLGHELGENTPFYSFGDVSDDGMWGVIGAWPRSGSTTVASLYDLADLENPVEAHQLENPQPGYRTNHVRFDGPRDGLYYITHESDGPDEVLGMSVVDFDWEEGSPDDPSVLATVDAPNTGAHTISEHPTEPVIYMVDTNGGSPGVIPVDVSDPHTPERAEVAGPVGYCHALEVDTTRDVLHCAYIGGAFVGYVILDIGDDPLAPTEIGRFDYDEAPDYTTVGEPGFESCHQAHFETERELAVVGDEIGSGVPGGKHMFDIGWDEGSLENPEPIGFTTSPDAREMAPGETYYWTTHFHDLLRDRGETLLVDGGYRNGVWVANITDPRNPEPLERYATDHDRDEAPAHHEEVWAAPPTPPFAWSARYNEARDFVFASDSITGAYTFDVSGKAARGKDEGGPGSHYDLERILEDG